MVGKSDIPADQVQNVAGKIAHYLTLYDDRHDPRAVFAYVYLRLTASLKESLERGVPSFDDPAWVAGLSQSLASEYFAAMDGIDRWLAARNGQVPARLRATDLPGDIPQPWRDVFANTADGRSYVLEDMLFAMMAHISYDLPIALRRLAESDDVLQHIADYHRMNAVLGAAIDTIQQEIASRYSYGLATLDRILARDDELLSNYGIRLSRGVAWFNFQRLSDSTASADAVRSISASTGSFIRQVRSPDDWRLRLILRAARHVIPARRQWPDDERGRS
jgi:hypothetical protein